MPLKLMNLHLLLLCSVAVLLQASPVLAWSDIGHRIICEIAFQELQASARERARAMIRQDPEFDTFAESCSWPDHPRRRDVGLRASTRTPCPLTNECVVSAIEKDLAVLSSSSAREERKLDAMKYLGHWVGDVHQPLHVSFEDDRGGNQVGVSGGLCGGDLHEVWDRCLIERGLAADPYSLARDLLAEVTEQDRATWRASTFMDWANESFAISVSPEVGYCVRTDAGCWYGTANERLDEGEPERTVVVDRSYIETHTPTVRDRLVKAGVRLEILLNQALGD